MTLEEIAITLPNGFHDAEVASIAIDYVARRAVLDLEVWLGDMSEVEAPREAYRRGKLTLEGLQFLVIEGPDARYGFAEQEAIRVDLSTEPTAEIVPAIGAMPEGCFASCFFVMDWNSCLYVGARAATLDWMGEMYDRGPNRAAPRPLT